LLIAQLSQAYSRGRGHSRLPECRTTSK